MWFEGGGRELIVRKFLETLVENFICGEFCQILCLKLENWRLLNITGTA